MISLTSNHGDIFQSPAYRSSCPKVSYESVLKNFEKFSIKYVLGIFSIKVARLTLLKTDSNTDVFL